LVKEFKTFLIFRFITMHKRGSADFVLPLIVGGTLFFAGTSTLGGAILGKLAKFLFYSLNAFS
jgi:hypothetical protein